jgi:hypothetical protein
VAEAARCSTPRLRRCARPPCLRGASGRACARDLRRNVRAEVEGRRPRPLRGVLALVALAAVALWPGLAAGDVAPMSDLGCGVLTVVQRALPLVVLTIGRRWTDLVHPAIIGTMLNACRRMGRDDRVSPLSSRCGAPLHLGSCCLDAASHGRRCPARRSAARDPLSIPSSVHVRIEPWLVRRAS